MPITSDDQIDLERVVTDPEYRRHVIVYLNAQARRRGRSQRSGGLSRGFAGSRRADRANQEPIRQAG